MPTTVDLYQSDTCADGRGGVVVDATLARCSPIELPCSPTGTRSNLDDADRSAALRLA